MHTGIGAPNGPGSQPFSRWFRYPAGFGSAALGACFRAANLGTRALIVDPFAGVGTTGVYAAGLGIACAGIETHPLIAEIAALKFQRPGLPQELYERATRLAESLAPHSIDSETVLVLQSFERDSLGLLVALRDRIAALRDDPWQLHLKWCLLGTLRDCATVKVGWPYQRPTSARVPRLTDPRRAFLRRAFWMAEDLSNGPASPPAWVRQGDCRLPAIWESALGGRSATAVITSPPYLNNFDYADATRLELYFWGAARSWLEMTQRVRSGMVIATTQQTRKGLVDVAVADLASRCPAISQSIRDLQSELERERGQRARGKEYDRVLPLYFAGLVQVLIQVAANTHSGAPVILVLGDSAPYGVYIDTPGLLAAAAEEIGFSRVSVEILRQRGLRWRTNGSRHSTALTEQLVLLRSPGLR